METTHNFPKQTTTTTLLLLLLVIAAGPALANSRCRNHRSPIPGIRSLKERDVMSNSSRNGEGREFFQVTKPVKVPRKGPCAVVQVVQHDFAFTYGKPPTVANYTPPTTSSSSSCKGGWTQAVLQWKASCKGVQYDRYAGVWLGGAEILRTTTAEPDATGVHWTVLKDITKYSALLRSPQTMEVQMYNLVNDQYTGIYHVNVSILFYAAAAQHETAFSTHPANVIVPLSLPSNHDGGAWFQISSPTDANSATFTVPTSAYRAVLEDDEDDERKALIEWLGRIHRVFPFKVFVSFHGTDEFWYVNPEDTQNTTKPGNGPFREVLLHIDDKIVGAVWPFPVIYTGGIDPSFWRPVTGIGSFDLPSYDIEVTPFLGMLLDGKQHKLSFTITNGVYFWLVDANLHIWTDKTNSATKGGLISYDVSPSDPSSVKAQNGSVITSANRRISAAGWLLSTSHGNLTTRTSNQFELTNVMVDDSQVQQNITSTSNVSVEASSTGTLISSTQITKFFPFGYNPATLSNAIYESKYAVAGKATYSSTLQNTQNIDTSSEKLTTRQMYDYQSPGDCYSRSVVVTDYSITSDSANTVCKSPV